MAEQQTLTNAWIGYGLGQHIEEVRRRQAKVTRLLPWPIADPRLVEALELMSAAVTELIEYHDELNDDDARNAILDDVSSTALRQPQENRPNVCAASGPARYNSLNCS